MSDVAAAGSLSLAVEALRTLIADVTFFRTWTGSADASAALKHIVLGAMGYNIASYSIASNVVTLNTVEPHNLAVADDFVIEGLFEDLDGSYTVATVPSARQITFAKTASNLDLESVHQGIVMQSHRPFVVLQEASDEGLRSELIASGGTNIVGGSIDIYLCAKISDAYKNDPRNAKVEMANAFGQFVDGLRALHGTADYLLLNSIAPVMMPTFISHPEMSDNQVRYEEWEASIRVTWGLEG